MKPLHCAFPAFLFITLFSGCADFFSDPIPEPTEEPAPTVSYSGRIIFPGSYDAHDRYIQVMNNSTGEYFQEKIGTDGSFIIVDTQGTGDVSTSGLFAFYDRNDNGVMDFLVDSIAYILTQNNNYANDVVYAELIELSGTIADSSDSNFAFSSEQAMSVLRLEDRVYWKHVFQPVASDGSFSVLAVAGHTVDLTLYKVSTDEAGFREDYSNRLRDPVRLFEPSAFFIDTRIHGINGNDSPMGILKISINYSNSLADYSAYPLFILAGQNPTSMPVWSADGTRMSGSPTSTGIAVPLHFYFRQFDRTTSSAGALLDEELTDASEGYGAFFSTLVFIDTNRDGAYNPGEPASGTYFHGDWEWDLNGDLDKTGIPDWGKDSDLHPIGDWSDEASPSYLVEDTTLDLVFSLE